MAKVPRICLSMLFMAQLASCSIYQSNKVIDDNLIMDYDWQADIYNLALVEATDTDNLRVWVKQGPGYFGGAPHQRACVEIAQPMKPDRFYIANLNLYSLIEVKNCNINFWEPSNLINPARSQMPGRSQMNAMRNDFQSNNTGQMDWENIPGILGYYADRSHLRLVFEGLFPVNGYQLTSAGRETLLLIIKRLLHKDLSVITIYGVADSSWGYSTNRGLADARARTVRDYFVKEGLSNVHYDLRGSVKNAPKIRRNCNKQCRFIIEVRFK